ILGWDQQTMMPPRGAAGRAEELATLGRVIHERFTSPEIGRLLDELASFEQEHPYDSLEASLVRVTRVDWEKARKVPADPRRPTCARRCRARRRSGTRCGCTHGPRTTSPHSCPSCDRTSS